MTAFVNRICASHTNERSTAHTAHCQTVMLTGTPQKSVPKRDENRSRSDEKTRKFRCRALPGASMRSWGVRDGARERPGKRRRRPGTDLGTPGEGQERSSGVQKRPQDVPGPPQRRPRAPQRAVGAPIKRQASSSTPSDRFFVVFASSRRSSDVHFASVLMVFRGHQTK